MSLKRRDAALDLIRILYFRLNKEAPLDVYRIPKKDLAQYEITEEEVRNSDYTPPKSKYLYFDSQSEGSSSEEDKQEPDEEEDKDDKFRKNDTGVDLGNKLFEKLGDKYMDKEQKVLNNQKSELLYSRKMRGRVIEDKYNIKKISKIGDFKDGKMKEIRGEKVTDEVDEESSEGSRYSSERSRSPSRSESSQESDSDDGPNDPSLRDFALIKMINKGGFGKVFLAKNTLDGKYYAMKRIRKDLLLETHQVDNTLNEKEILLSNNNPFLLSMDYVYQSEFRLYFFMEYINGGNLYENMFKVKRFKEPQVKFFIAQVVIALGYLHKNKVVHRDIKPENVILRENGYCVLADFGLAKILDTKTKFARTY